MEEIISNQNNKIKLLKKLALKKYRQENGKFVVENLATICDALKDGICFESLFVTSEFVRKNKEQFEHLERSGRDGQFFLIDEKINRYFSQLDNPAGIAAVYPIELAVLDKDCSVIYLNGVSDPGNLGTILRAALAFGFENIMVDEDCADLYNAKVVSAAKNAIFKLNIIADKAGEWLKKTKLPIYATSSHDGVGLNEFAAAENFALVLGSEGQGVADWIMKKASVKIKIAMSDKIESLNVAVAAGVLMYELYYAKE